MSQTAAAALVERAAALVPLLRNGAAAAESARRLPQATFDALSEADVFRMTAPKRFGGTKPTSRRSARCSPRSRAAVRPRLGLPPS